MARIEISSVSNPYGTGELQLQGKVAMSGTLTAVTDNLNNASPLKLSTGGVQVASTLQITTNSNPYIDAEDGAGNNRFTVGRDPSSQVVNVDFASNPTGGTNQVGAIRTYRDGISLSEVMSFRKDGQIDINTNSFGNQNWSQNINFLGSTGELKIANNGGGGFFTSFTFGANELMRLNSALQVGIGTNSPNARTHIKGSGSTSATTSLLVQNSNGQNNFKITDSGSLITATNMTISWTGGASSKNIFYNDSASGWGGFIFNSSLTYSGNVNELLVIATTKNAFKNPLAIGVALDVNDNLPLMSNSAILQADSTTQGFLPPRMTTIQKNAIVSPAIGLMVFDTTLNRPCFYNGIWVTL